jgi:NADH:ubiquinone oxidoreductase subunit K
MTATLPVQTPQAIVMAAAIGLLAVGIYGLMASSHLIRLVIALQLVVKSAVLALVAAGARTGASSLGESVAIVVIVADTVIAVVLLALAVRVHRTFGTLDVRALSRLRG